MTDTTTALDLAAIRRREQAATRGPWHVEYLGDHGGYPQRITNDAAILVAETFQASGNELEPDPEFIAAARTDVPDLLAEVDRLRAQLDANAHEHHNRVTRLERYINGLETQCNTQMHELAAALNDEEQQRAANAIRAYIRLCGSNRISDDHPLHALADKLTRTNASAVVSR